MGSFVTLGIGPCKNKIAPHLLMHPYHIALFLFRCAASPLHASSCDQTFFTGAGTPNKQPLAHLSSARQVSVSSTSMWHVLEDANATHALQNVVTGAAWQQISRCDAGFLRLWGSGESMKNLDLEGWVPTADLRLHHSAS